MRDLDPREAARAPAGASRSTSICPGPWAPGPPARPPAAGVSGRSAILAARPRGRVMVAGARSRKSKPSR
jgi:hypothetical protein